MLAFSLSDSGADRILKQIFYGLVVIFGVCAALALRGLFGLRGPVVTISSQGFRDTRLAAELIPWRAVRGVSAYNGALAWQQRVMVLAVDPVTEARLTLPLLARLTRRPNRWLGA